MVRWTLLISDINLLSHLIFDAVPLSEKRGSKDVTSLFPPPSPIEIPTTASFIFIYGNKMQL